MELGTEETSPATVFVCPAPEEEVVTTQVVPTTTPEPPPEKPRLGELTVTDATPDSLSLSWTVPEGRFDHFLVQYKNGDGQPKVVRVPGHEDQVTIPGLEPDHKYKMNLYGIHSGQRVGPVSATGVTGERMWELRMGPPGRLISALVTARGTGGLGLVSRLDLIEPMLWPVCLPLRLGSLSWVGVMISRGQAFAVSATWGI